MEFGDRIAWAEVVGKCDSRGLDWGTYPAPFSAIPPPPLSSLVLALQRAFFFCVLVKEDCVEKMVSTCVNDTIDHLEILVLRY